MKVKKLLEPKLRFNKFQDEWKKFKLGELVNFLDEKRKPIKDSDRNKFKGIYPYYGASGIIDYVREYIFDQDTILLGEDGANILARSTRLAFIATGKYWVNNHAHVLEPKESDIYFLCELLESLKYEQYNTGTAQPKLNQEVCKNIEIIVPSIIEQEKIGKFLVLLNKKIELQKQKIEALKIYKRGFIMQILKDDNTNSKNYHISECINIFDKRTTINNQYTILSSTQNGLQIQNDYFNRQTASENNIGYKIIPRNYITYRSMSDTGDFYFNLQNIVDFGIVSPAYPVFRTSNFVDIHYFLYYLNYSSNMKRQILLNKEGGTRFALSINKLSDIHISLPSYETQINHSYIFRTLDKKINLGEQKLHKLNLLKTSLLQQMFI